MFYFWGYTSAFLSYSALCHFFPAEGTYVSATIHDDRDVIEAADEKTGDSDSQNEKKANDITETQV
jgi:nucleobase:cation symporter-1, NCS1 family